MKDARGGVALILVIGILGVLAILGVAFGTLTRLERRASQQRTHATRAFLLARSGIEDALARMAAGQDPVENRLLGRSGKLSGDGAPDDSHYALRVSSGGFFVNGGDPAQGGNVGYNAVLRRMLEILAREISSPVSQPDGRALIDSRPSSGWDSFAQIRDRALGGSQTKLDALKPYLTLKAWTDKRVISPGLGIGYANRSFSCRGDLKLIVRQQTDPSLCAPDFERMPRNLRGRVVGRAPVEFSWARTRRPALMALLEGLQGLYLDDNGAKLAPFAPGYAYEDAPWTVHDPNAAGGGDVCGRLRAVTLGGEDLLTAVSAFLTTTSDLSTWRHFNAFCDDIPLGSTSTTDNAALRDAIKANFNPNPDLNKFNPCRGMRRLIDKSDLTVYSTEFGLAPVQARRIESLGTVLDAAGRVLARRMLQAIASSPGVVRLATQKEFVSEDLGSLEYAGDESVARLPGFCAGGRPAFVTPSLGIDTTWGQRIDTTGADPASSYGTAAGNWMTSSGRGASLQTYPEPCFDTTPNDTATQLGIRPADYAGNLQLATIETPKDAWYGVRAPTPEMKLLAAFDDGFDLDDWDSPRPDAGFCLPGSRQPTTSELGLSVWARNPQSKLNTLYPDGAYSEARRVPSYLDHGNAHGLHGTLSFWVKTDFDLPYYDDRGPASMRRSHAFVMRSRPGSPSQQFFFVGDGHSSSVVNSASGLCLLFETGRGANDYTGAVAAALVQEHAFTKGFPAPHTWQLVTAGWDFLSPTRDGAGEFVLDAATTGSANTYYPTYGDRAMWLLATDLTEDLASGPHRMALGAQGENLLWGDGTMGIAPGADATLDELVIYDFGGYSFTTDLSLPTVADNGTTGVLAPDAAALSAPNELAIGRWQAGRYHKGSQPSPPAGSPFDPSPDAAWISAPIRLPGGSVLQEIRWTWHSPVALPSDHAEVEILREDLAGHLWASDDSRSVLGRASRPDSWTPGRPAGGAFRARVVFRREDPSTVTPSIPILESPVFDDLTILYLPPGGPVLLSYGDE